MKRRKRVTLRYVLGNQRVRVSEQRAKVMLRTVYWVLAS